MSLTSPIPKEMREEMSQDPYYKKCCITGRSDEKIDWHHNLTFKGKRVNEKFCILPLAKSVHDKLPKELCDWVMWNRATDEEIARYSKAENYQLTKERLNKKYGIYRKSDTTNYLAVFRT
jgi:hypothetical protein